MSIQIAESIWLNDTAVCSIEHLAEVSGLSVEEIEDLIDNGVIVPIDSNVRPRAFQLHTIVIAQTARRLRDDFELDRHGVALALSLLRRMDDLQAELNATLAKRGRRTEK